MIMTREELITKVYDALVIDYFPAWNNLSVEEITGLATIVTKIAEPLFEGIENLEKKIQSIESLSTFRQNEISGLQKILDQKDIEIKRLKTDIADLSFCEDCGDEAERIPENNCFPPRYCHKCRFPELHKLFNE